MVWPLLVPITLLVGTSVTGTTTTGLFLFRFVPWIKEAIHDFRYKSIVVMRNDSIALYAEILIAISDRCESLSKKALITVRTPSGEKICYAPPMGESIELESINVTCVSRSGVDVDGVRLFYLPENEAKAQAFLKSMSDRIPNVQTPFHVEPVIDMTTDKARLVH